MIEYDGEEGERAVSMTRGESTRMGTDISIVPPPK
jgi:hypothetical protein